jgi:hypothetical protein
MNVSGQFAQEGNTVSEDHNQTRYQKNQPDDEKYFAQRNHCFYSCYLWMLHFSLDIDRRILEI